MFIKIFELTKFLAYTDAAQLQLVSLIEIQIKPSLVYCPVIIAACVN